MCAMRGPADWGIGEMGECTPNPGSSLLMYMRFIEFSKIDSAFDYVENVCRDVSPRALVCTFTDEA